MTGELCRQAIDTGGCVLLVPGLLAANIDHAAKNTKTLCRMLGLAAVEDLPDGSHMAVESLVAEIVMNGQSRTCAAILSYLEDFPQNTDARVLRADPAYQQIDMNNATLANPAELELGSEECDSLLLTLNHHFAEDAIRFEHRKPNRWYCHFDEMPEVFTTPLSAAVGRDVTECRPSGADSRTWRQKLAEIEMLLFEHPVNIARERKSQLPVNTLWLWGEGTVSESAGDVHIVTDNFYTTSLANHYKLACESLPDKSDLAINAETNGCLIVIDKFIEPAVQQNSDHYNKLLHWLEQNICKVLWSNLKRDGCSEIVLWCGDNRLFRLGLADKKQFWRRAWIQPPSLNDFAPSSAEMPALQQESSHREP